MKYFLIWFIYSLPAPTQGVAEFYTLERCNHAKEQILSKALGYRKELQKNEMVECFKK